MLGKVLSHPMTILALVYAACVLTTVWMAITRRLHDLRQQPAGNRARSTFRTRRRLSGVAA